jgi:hypothetical protein
LIAAAMTAYLAADVNWNWLTLAGHYVPGSYFDVGWMLLSVLIGASALHPSMAKAGTVEQSRSSLSRLGAGALACAALTPAGLTAYQRLRDGRASLAVVGGGAVRTCVVVIRLLAVVRRAEHLSLALGRAEQKFRSLVEGLPLVTYIDAVDDLATNLYTSPQVKDLLGYSAEEWTSDPYMLDRLLHPR